MWRSPLLLVAIAIIAPILPGTAMFGPASAHAAQASSESGADEVRAESTHFIVSSYRGGPRASDVASRCETIWLQLRRDCLGRPKPIAWRPKCQVILHSTQSSYRRATGRGSTQTVGASTVTIRASRVSQRRIDLLVENADQALSALPHEMTHVLLADLFPTSPPPRWAEEGLALLADPADKRARHARDLRRALQSNTTLPLVTFFLDAEYPAARDRAVFYAQSMSLTEYLVNLDSSERFVEFVETAQDVGHLPALQRVYGIRGLDELESKWLRYAASQAVTPGGVPVSRRVDR